MDNQGEAMSGAEPMPIGRDAEAARVSGFLGELPRGPCVLLIEGEAGIGKTTLLKQGHDTAVRPGITVLSAYPVESEVPLAFAGLADLLETVPAALVEGLPVPQRQAIRQAVVRAEPPLRSADPRTTGTAVLALLRCLARRQPVVVVVDDLPLLDTPSARALSFALRRLRLEPVGLLAAVRTNWSADPPPLATDSVPAGRVDCLRLGPLSLGAIRELLATRTTLSVGRSLLLRLHGHRGGILRSRWSWPRGLTPTCGQGCTTPSMCLIRCGGWCSSGSPDWHPGRVMCSWSPPFLRRRCCRSSALPPAIRPARTLISKRASGRVCWPGPPAESLSSIR